MSRAPHIPLVKASTMTEAEALRHPRRKPAEQSVSLVHSRHAPHGGAVLKHPHGKQSSLTNHPSNIRALRGKGSSGESSNVDRWFEQSNNEVVDKHVLLRENESPYFMRRSSSEESPPDGQQKQADRSVNNDPANSLRLRADLLQLGTDGSSTEDYRGVIDDLTIENKRLKRQLKKYKILQDSPLKEQKLFEVRIHGLPAEKKRELEETLRNFTASLGPSEADHFPANGYEGLTLKAPTVTPTWPSYRHQDSGYASVSGQGSSAQSGMDGKPKPSSSQSSANRRENIHSYLHDIPQGLLPKENPTVMTERAKKKVVVRKLEQIFAGKGAATGGHQQSLQQQEISQSAARTEGSNVEATNQRSRQEGIREAHILQEVPQEPSDSREAPQSRDELADDSYVKNMNTAVGNLTDRSPTELSLEQRPTRPLDLDPHRAQIPLENVRYMRHLGFSPRNPESSEPPEEGHSWIYLNFLINMAQLHTINVTPDFVREALNDYSDKFEISQDGRKARWKGGHNLTRTSSNEGESSNEHTGQNTPDAHNPRKRVKLTRNDSSSSDIQKVATYKHNKYAYTPIFFQRPSTDEEDSSPTDTEKEDDLSMISPWPATFAHESSRMTSSGIQAGSGLTGTHPVKKRTKRDDGPIIFYNNANFFTDLTGDDAADRAYNAPPYISAGSVPVGQARRVVGKLMEKRGPLARVTALPKPRDLDGETVSSETELSLPEDSTSEPHKLDMHKPIGFEVSGIGGVCPADNFAVFIQTRHADVEEDSDDDMEEIKPRPIATCLSRHLLDSHARSRNLAKRQSQITAAKLRRLPPSELPPALGFFGDGSMEDDDSSDEEDVSDKSEMPRTCPPSVGPQAIGVRFASSEEHDEDDEIDEDDDTSEDADEEVDFLAAARTIDPEAVRLKERDYDANMAERLAEEIPAGSSAATAGGGSGFGSPADGVTASRHQLAAQEARAKLVGLRRAVPGGAQPVQMDVSDSEDDDDENDSDDDMSDVRS